MTPLFAVFFMCSLNVIVEPLGIVPLRFGTFICVSNVSMVQMPV